MKMDFVYFNANEYGREHLEKLLDFYLNYKRLHHLFFIKLKYEYEELTGRKANCLCSEIDGITGKWIPVDKLKGWSWGDGRALGLWSYHLLARSIEYGNVDIFPFGRKNSVDLKREYEDYCKAIYESLVKRCEANNGYFPFTVNMENNIDTEAASRQYGGNRKRNFSDLFCVCGILQYALLRRDRKILNFEMKIFDECVETVDSWQLPGDYVKISAETHHVGPAMILLGVCVDLLRGMLELEKNNTLAFCEDFKIKLLKKGASIIYKILADYCDAERGIFWEFNTVDGQVMKDASNWYTDPGHAVECVGFIAEFIHISEQFRLPGISICDRNKILETVSGVNHFMAETGYSKIGLMYKKINLNLPENPGVYDAEIQGRKIRTAPWWNVREHSSASLRLFSLTGDKTHLTAYQKAQNATYRFYPNPQIDNMMFKTLDADTGLPAALNPSTGNFDPMHDERARDREIEVIEALRNGAR